MHLNIKNDDAHELAAKLARLTGESITTAVTKAIHQRLEHEQRLHGGRVLAQELLEIGRRCAAYPRRDKRKHGEFLYDKRGLPKT